MSDKHAAAWHTGHADCGCGETHTSVLASIYCAESMESEGRAARREPKAPKPNAYIRSID